MAAEVIQETGKNVGEFVTDFSQTYIKTLISLKINGAIEDAIGEVMPSQLQQEEEDPLEEKSLEDKEAGTVLASGVVLCGYKHGWGPDKVQHRYYDLAVFAIREEDSVIDKVTYRHRQLLDFANSIKKKVAGIPDVPFPGKKWTKKDPAYYRERFTTMNKWFDTMSNCEAVRMHQDWLNFFKLQFDAAKAERLELFFTALEAQCEKDGINWSRAFKQAQKLGLDTYESEMLKVVAVEKVGRDASRKIAHEINTNAPGFVPSSVKGKFISKMDSKMAGVISTTVETGWKAAEEGFNKVAEGLGEALDKATAPLKEIFVKVLTPVKELIESKMGEPKEDEDPIDAKLKAIKSRRFPNVAKALDGWASSDATVTCSNLMSSCCDLNYVHRYVPYIQYNCGDPEIVEWFPPIEKMTERHQRLTIALVDVAYVISRSMCRAVQPLCAYVDKAASGFDAGSHEKKVREALQEGGKKLAMDYFHLPYSCWRATWYCGHRVTKDVLRFARVSINEAADALGRIAIKWKPTSNDDVRSTFATCVEESLDKFLGERVFAMCTLIRNTAMVMIGAIFEECFGEAIEAISSTLDELVSLLPPPLNELAAGDIVANFLFGLVEKLAEKTVRVWAKKPEMLLADPESTVEEGDEATASKYRYAPRIIDDGDDLAEAQAESDDEDGGEAKKDE